MKHILFFGLLASVFVACSTPDAESKKVSSDTRFEDSILKKAMKRNDVGTALNHIHIILEKDSTRLGLYDTLFQYYFQMQNPEGVADVGQILLEAKPNDLEILEATAMGLAAVMDYEKALVLHQRMFAITGDPRLKITTATLLFELKRTEDARKEIQWIIDNGQATDTVKVEQPSPSFKDRTQKIKIKAVAYYSLGQIEYSLGNKKKAIQFWEKSLEIEPTYDLAATSILEVYK